MKWLTDSWYRPQLIRFLLLPFSLTYQLVIACRVLAYRTGLFNSQKLGVPVIVIGNITVGGTGKTPVVIWLAKQLIQAGFKPGIISRGYGGKAQSYPHLVEPDSDARVVGDEPVIISQHTNCPMAVSPIRAEAGQLLIDQYDCNIIISDDGLQHYALERDIEIAVVDGVRFFGNHYCLPAGPLREPLSRLRHVDFVILNGGPKESHYKMLLQAGAVINLADTSKTKSLADFHNHAVHCVAGIGHPERFFSYLSSHELIVETHDFADHHDFSATDLNFGDDKPIIMTEKDAVKCRAFANDKMWYIPVEASISGELEKHILTKLVGSKPHG